MLLKSLKKYNFLTQRGFANKLKNYINGEWVEAPTGFKVYNPASCELVTEIPQTPKVQFDLAVNSASKAFKTWGQTNVMARARYMIQYQQLLRKNLDRIAYAVYEEQGKTLADA